MLRNLTSLLALLIAFQVHAGAAGDRFGPADLARLADVAEPEFSPDREQVAYSVTTTNVAADKRTSDLWRVRFDGRDRVQLTNTPEHNEWRPRWAPDASALAFLSDRGGEDAETQVWLMPALGGEARRLTDFPAGVEDYAWSPDGKRLAIIARDPERPAGEPKPKNPPPIVTDRYWFKEDGTGYLGDRRQHLYVFDVATGKSELLTPGAHDEYLPAELSVVEQRGLRPLSAHNEWLATKRLATVEDISFRSADGTAIDGFLVKPVDYVKGRRYPTILRIHGGPVYQFSHEFMPDWQAYAAAGYVVVATNPRGSSGRGSRRRTRHRRSGAARRRRARRISRRCTGTTCTRASTTWSLGFRGRTGRSGIG